MINADFGNHGEIADLTARVTATETTVATHIAGAPGEMRNLQFHSGSQTYGYDNNGVTTHTNRWTKVAPSTTLAGFHGFCSFKIFSKGDTNHSGNSAHAYIDWGVYFDTSTLAHSVDVDVFAGLGGMDFYLDPNNTGIFYIRRQGLWIGGLMLWLETASDTALRFDFTEMTHTEVPAAVEADFVSVTKSAPFTRRVYS